MKIRNITPDLFGQFQSAKPLDLPDSPMVVVYGDNEVGKTTYADMAVTLMSPTYDKDLLSRYGGFRAPLKGSIKITGGKDSVTVRFKTDAAIPQKSGVANKRMVDVQNDLWEQMQKIQATIIRNIFRVSSDEITVGTSSKEKFDAYGLGDREGTSIRKTLEKYEAGQKEASREAKGLRGTIVESNSQLRDAQKSTNNHDRVLGEILKLENQIEEIQRKENIERRRQDQVAFCQGAQGTISDGKSAEFELEQIKVDGFLIDTQFSQIEERIRQIIINIEELRIDSIQRELDRLQSDLNTATDAVNASLAPLRLSQEDIVKNPSIMNNQAIVEIQNLLVEKALKRAGLEEESKEQEINGRRNDLIKKSQERVSADANWKKFNLGVTAQEYLASPRISAPISTQSMKSRFLSWSYLIPIIGAGFLLLPISNKQIVGIGISIAYLILLVLLRRTSSPVIVEQGSVGSEQSGAIVILNAANRVNGAEIAQDIEDRAIQDLELDEKERISKISGLSVGIQDILNQHHIRFETSSNVQMFRDYFENLRSTAKKCADETAVIGQVSNQEAELRRAQERLVHLNKEVEEIFLTVGIPFGKAFFASASGAVLALRKLTEDFARQLTLRKKITAKNQLSNGRGDEKEIQLLMESTPDELIRIRDDSAGLLTVLIEDRKKLENDRRIKNGEREILENSSQMSDLRSGLGYLEEQIQDQHLLELQFAIQAHLLRKYATKRAEESKPELVKKVQLMVLKVADDWESLEFPTNDEGIIEDIKVKYKNGSTVSELQLSSGAKSLVYLAMRIAVMHQEASNGLSIPLFCDDPLLYMDTERTRLGLQMLSNAAVGHQIIYFTCKQEIYDLATELMIPVVRIE